jgi:ADP-heptose:LPS heptosyltransferase
MHKAGLITASPGITDWALLRAKAPGVPNLKGAVQSPNILLAGGPSHKDPGTGRSLRRAPVADRPQGHSRFLGITDHELCIGQRRRVLVLTLGGIGDSVLSFAAWRDLRRACPEDHLTALAMWSQSAELLEDLGIFDEVQWHNFQQDRAWRSWGKALQLRSEHYDASLLAFPTNRFEYNALAFLLGAKERWGHTYVRGGDVTNLRFLLTNRIEQRLGRHVIDENRALVAAFTGSPSTDPADIRLGPLAPRYHRYAAWLLGHLREPLLGIHAGSSAYKGLAAKRWPAEQFGHLCQRAHREFGLQPVVFGAPDELELKLRIQSLCPEAFFAHGDSIRLTAALIGKCAAFVSNDSGLAHIAAAMDVPVVMLCGPTDPGEVGRYTGHGQCLQAGLKCSPCFRVGRQPMRCHRNIYQACMKQITVGAVLEALASCLPRRSSIAEQAIEPLMRSDGNRRREEVQAGSPV